MKLNKTMEIGFSYIISRIFPYDGRGPIVPVTRVSRDPQPGADSHKILFSTLSRWAPSSSSNHWYVLEFLLGKYYKKGRAFRS